MRNPTPSSQGPRTTPIPALWGESKRASHMHAHTRQCTACPRTCTRAASRLDAMFRARAKNASSALPLRIPSAQQKLTQILFERESPRLARLHDVKQPATDTAHMCQSALSVGSISHHGGAPGAFQARRRTVGPSAALLRVDDERRDHRRRHPLAAEVRRPSGGLRAARKMSTQTRHVPQRRAVRSQWVWEERWAGWDAQEERDMLCKTGGGTAAASRNLTVSAAGDAENAMGELKHRNSWATGRRNPTISVPSYLFRYSRLSVVPIITIIF